MSAQLGSAVACIGLFAAGCGSKLPAAQGCEGLPTAKQRTYLALYGRATVTRRQACAALGTPKHIIVTGGTVRWDYGAAEIEFRGSGQGRFRTIRK